MEKLELKHLAPYLPYELEIINTIRDLRLTLKGVQTDLDIIHSHGKTPIKFIKLVLRPLSDLTKEIEHNGEKFVPLAEILIAIPSAAFRFKIHKNTVIECWEDKEDGKHMKFYLDPIMGMNEFQHIQKLFEWHFDVEGLIEKGLAIDINTL